MKIAIFSVLLIVILTAGCDEKDLIKGIDVSGYVLEYGTLDPVEGARVYLVTGSAGNWGTTDTLVTGPDGRYAFRHPEREPGTLVALYVFADGYYDILEEAVLYPWKKQEIDIVMDPHAWLKLNVDVHFTDINTKLMYWGGGGTGREFFGGITIEEIYIRPGNRYNTVAWSFTLGDEIQSFIDSIYMPAHDTAYFEIRN